MMDMYLITLQVFYKENHINLFIFSCYNNQTLGRTLSWYVTIALFLHVFAVALYLLSYLLYIFGVF